MEGTVLVNSLVFSGNTHDGTNVHTVFLEWRPPPNRSQPCLEAGDK